MILCISPRSFFGTGFVVLEATMKKMNIKKMTVVAMLTALGYLCMLVFRFKVGFLTFDIKDAVLAITSLIYGPMTGIFASASVALLELVTVSDTGIYGLIMNFLSSATFTAVVGLVYKYRRSLSGAVLGAIAAALSVTAVMLLANLFITPYYMGVERGEVVKMLGTLLLPFNLTKSVFNGALVLLIYKPSTLAFRRTGLLPKSEAGQYRFGLKSVLLMVSSAIVLILVLLFFILKLHGEIVFFN